MHVAVETQSWGNRAMSGSVCAISLSVLELDAVMSQESGRLVENDEKETALVNWEESEPAMVVRRRGKTRTSKITVRI